MVEDRVASGASAVAADPFWSVVRRRHPDLNIVLLPDTPEPPSTAGTPVENAEAAATRIDADVRALWHRLSPDRVPDLERARWRSGPTSDALVREVTLSAEDLDVVEATSVLSRAARVLADEGWHTLEPPDGLPRIMAGREQELGRRELQLVHVPTTARLVLRIRSEPVVVGEVTARHTPRSAS